MRIKLYSILFRSCARSSRFSRPFLFSFIIYLFIYCLQLFGEEMIRSDGEKLYPSSHVVRFSRHLFSPRSLRIFDSFYLFNFFSRTSGSSNILFIFSIMFFFSARSLGVLWIRSLSVISEIKIQFCERFAHTREREMTLHVVGRFH